MVRCKMVLTKVALTTWGSKELEFEARYDQSIPEDIRFQKASPSGSHKISIDNPAAVAFFMNEDGTPKFGKGFYFDVSESPEG